jgi:Intracellular proteinase inhibitor
MSRHRYTLASTLFVALWMAGCHDAPRQVAGPAFADGAAIFTVVNVSPTEFKAGETVNVTVQAHNPTAEPIRLHFASGCLVGFSIKASDGTIVGPTGIICTANAPTLVLGPGEDIAQTFDWDGRARTGFGPALPPGEYHITGSLNAAESHDPSAPVTVKILP